MSMQFWDAATVRLAGLMGRPRDSALQAASMSIEAMQGSRPALRWAPERLTCCAAPTVAKTGSNAGSIDTPHASFGNAAMASLQEAPAQPPSEAFTEELAAQLLEKYKLWQQQMSSLVASVACFHPI